jgi:hypothetical protein
MGKVKIRFVLDADQWHGSATETLWADPLDSGLHRLDNLPFLAFGVSFNDIIKTELSSDGIEDFVSVSRLGGHSTYRVIVHGEKLPEDRLKQIGDLGCLYEVGKIGEILLVSVSVPPDSSIQKVYSELEAGEFEEIWEFEESNFEHSV